MIKERPSGVESVKTTVLETPFNGFLFANRVERISSNAFSYTLDGTNYKTGIQVPQIGEFMVLPTDVIENMHFHLFCHYSTQKLDVFSFNYSHFSDQNGEFVGKRFEIGTEAVLKDFATQDLFKKMYISGTATYKVEDSAYNFFFDKENDSINFYLNDSKVVQIPSKPFDISRNTFLSLPVSRFV